MTVDSFLQRIHLLDLIQFAVVETLTKVMDSHHLMTPTRSGLQGRLGHHWTVKLQEKALIIGVHFSWLVLLFFVFASPQSSLTSAVYRWFYRGTLFTSRDIICPLPNACDVIFIHLVYFSFSFNSFLFFFSSFVEMEILFDFWALLLVHIWWIYLHIELCQFYFFSNKTLACPFCSSVIMMFYVLLFSCSLFLCVLELEPWFNQDSPYHLLRQA